MTIAITRVRTLAQQTATRDMDASVAAKSKTDSLITQVAQVSMRSGAVELF